MRDSIVNCAMSGLCHAVLYDFLEIFDRYENIQFHTILSASFRVYAFYDPPWCGVSLNCVTYDDSYYIRGDLFGSMRIVQFILHSDDIPGYNMWVRCHK